MRQRNEKGDHSRVARSIAERKKLTDRHGREGVPWSSERRARGRVRLQRWFDVAVIGLCVPAPLQSRRGTEDANRQQLSFWTTRRSLGR
jgi:hypothetical protein